MNLVDRQIEIYTIPNQDLDAPAYQQRQDYAIEQAVPVQIGDRSIALLAVKSLLP